MQIILKILFTLAVFCLGFWLSYLMFQEKVQYEIPILSIRACNQTDEYIEDINIADGPGFHEIKPGECSEYISYGALYSHLALSILSGDYTDDKRYSYSVIDRVGAAYLLPGRYTVNITDFRETDRKFTQYFDAIDYKLERDGVFDNPYEF